MKGELGTQRKLLLAVACSLAREKVCSPLYIEITYGKAVLNSSLLRDNRFCRSNRSVIGLRKVSVKTPYKTKTSSAESTESTCDS